MSSSPGLEQPELRQDDSQADDGERGAAKDIFRRPPLQGGFLLLLSLPSNHEGGLILPVLDQVAVVHVLGGGVFRAGPDDVVPVAWDDQVLREAKPAGGASSGKGDAT